MAELTIIKIGTALLEIALLLLLIMAISIGTWPVALGLIILIIATLYGYKILTEQNTK